MKYHIYSALRFFLYGLICFGVFGVVMEWSYIENSDLSSDFVGFLALLGGGSFVVSYFSCAILLTLVKDLTVGNN